MTEPIKTGTRITVNATTGEITQVQPRAMTLLPPAPGKCPECAVAHASGDPHNQQSLYYQVAFRSQHGRSPTWSDAMAHCSPEVQRHWRQELVQMMREKGMQIPKDLLPTESPDLE